MDAIETWNDAQLVAAVGGGSTQAEAEVCVRYRARIRRKVDASLRGSPDAEDLTSEILQATIESLRRGSFRGECQLGTFVHAVSRNKIAEYIRRRRPESVELTEDVPDHRISPEEEVIRGEIADAVRKAVGELKPKYRNVLYLYYFRGLSIAEIAARLGAPGRRVSEWKDYGLKMIRSKAGPSLLRFR